MIGTRARQARHLARRFFDSLSDQRPSEADDRWIRAILLPGEQQLWDRMSAPDQRHGVQVARDVERVLPAPTRPVLAAAVLHDIGKLACGYGTFGRVGATLFWGAVPGMFRGRLAFAWAAGEGFGRFGVLHRLGQYRIHPELGREMLAEAGSDDFTSRWAGEHHTPIDKWSVDRNLGLVLKECDDD